MSKNCPNRGYCSEVHVASVDRFLADALHKGDSATAELAAQLASGDVLQICNVLQIFGIWQNEFDHGS